MILIICSIALILLFVFRTDCWLEYCQLLKLDKISHYIDFNLKKSNDISLTYLEYLRQYHNCFFIRLITCPICLATWLGIIAALVTWSLIFIPVYVISSLLVFTTVDKLLG